MFEDNYLTIAQSTLLNMLPAPDVLKYLQQGAFRVVSFPRGSVVHIEGEQCTKLELVLSGKLVVERISETGDLLTVADFGPNDILGGGLIFSRTPFYPMTVNAEETSAILQIPRDILFELLSSNRGFLLAFLELNSDRTSVLTDKIKHYLNRPLRDRICSFLDQQRRLQQSKCIELPMTKLMLAQKLGVQRTSLSRELQKMQAEGLISFDARTITILY